MTRLDCDPEGQIQGRSCIKTLYVKTTTLKTYRKPYTGTPTAVLAFTLGEIERSNIMSGKFEPFILVLIQR